MLRHIILPMAAIAAPVAATAILAPVAAHAQTASEQAAINLALSRGKLLYAYDQAAWHGTDDMVTRIKDPASLLGGYIVDGPADAPTVIFYDKDEANPKAVYTGQLKDGHIVGGRVLDEKEDRALSPQVKAMIAARAKGIQAWLAAKPVYCGEGRPNVAVLPPEKPGGPFLVYVMTPQTDNLAWPMGGHFRVAINADGSVGESRGFTRSCLTLPVEKGAEAMVITHLLDPVPTEIHVFTAIGSGMPVAVVTGEKRIWWVTADAVTTRDLK